MKNALQKISVSVVEDDAKVRQKLVSWIRSEADLPNILFLLFLSFFNFYKPTIIFYFIRST